jgi:glycine dehydrogenase subunit 1
MGRRGFRKSPKQCAQKAAYARETIASSKGFSLPFTGPYFNEFVVRAPDQRKNCCLRVASEKNIDGRHRAVALLSGPPNDFLVCVTETNSRAQIDALVEGFGR